MVTVFSYQDMILRNWTLSTRKGKPVQRKRRKDQLQLSGMRRQIQKRQVGMME